MIITTTKTLRPRQAFDFYPTPIEVCEASLDLLPSDFEPEYVLDPCAGAGVYGVALKRRFPTSILAGMDIRGIVGTAMYLGAQDAYALRRPEEYDFWQMGRDFTRSTPAPVFDLVFSNPPYGIAEEFVWQALAWLRDGGWLIYLLRLAFLEGSGRYAGLYQEAPPLIVAPCVDRPSFTGDGGVDATAYAVFVWQKGAKPNCPTIRFLNWKNRPLQLSMWGKLA